MIREPIKTPWVILLGILSIVLLLLCYTELSRRQHVKNPEDRTIPTWSQLADGVKRIVEVNERSGERWLLEDSRATIARLFTGLFLGVAGATFLGMLMGCFATWEAFLTPPMSLLAKVPPTAALAVFLVLSRTDSEFYVIMIAFGILPTLAQSVYLAIRDVPREQLYKAYTLGASSAEVIWNVVLRAVLPRLIDGVRLMIGPAMVYLIAAEWIQSDVGFGYRFRMQMKLLEMNVVYPYLAILAAFGFFMDYTLRITQRVCCPWYAGKGR